MHKRFLSSLSAIMYWKQEEQYKRTDFCNTIIFQSKPDTGIYNAMNKGICVATGEYVIFMNTDDYYATTKAIEILVEKLERQNADLVYGNTIPIDKNNNTIKVLFANVAIFACDMSIPHNTILCKKSLYIDRGYFNEQLKIVADYDWVFNIILHNHTLIFQNTQPITTFRNTGISTNPSLAKIIQAERKYIYEKYYGKELSNKDVNALIHKGFLSPL